MGVSEPLIQTSLLGEAIEHTPVAVFVADEHGMYVAVNPAACTMLGYERGELVGLHCSDVARDGASDEARSELLRNGTHRGTSRLTRKDGTIVEFAYAAAATTVAGMPGFVSVGAFAPAGR